MKTRFLGLILMATMLVSGSTSAQNSQKQNESPRRDKERIERNMKPRGDREDFFTDEQKGIIKEMRLELAKQMKPLKNELGELEARQRTLSTQEKPDMKTIFKNIDKMSEVKTEIAKIMAQHIQDVRAMLDEEQLLKFDAMKKRQLDFHQDFNRRGRLNKMDNRRFEKS